VGFALAFEEVFAGAGLALRAAAVFLPAGALAAGFAARAVAFGFAAGFAGREGFAATGARPGLALRAAGFAAAGLTPRVAGFFAAAAPRTGCLAAGLAAREGVRAGTLFPGFALAGLALVGLALVGLALVGLALVGLALVELALVELALVGPAFAGTALTLPVAARPAGFATGFFAVAVGRRVAAAATEWPGLAPPMARSAAFGVEFFDCCSVALAGAARRAVGAAAALLPPRLGAGCGRPRCAVSR
jgi:hypothetical protein